MVAGTSKETDLLNNLNLNQQNKCTGIVLFKRFSCHDLGDCLDGWVEKIDPSIPFLTAFWVIASDVVNLYAGIFCLSIAQICTNR